MSFDLWKIGTTAAAASSRVPLLPSRAEEAGSEPTLYDEMLEQYGAIVEQFFTASGTSLGKLDPVEIDGNGRRKSSNAPPLLLDTGLLSVLLALYYAEGWPGLARYDEGWRTIALKPAAPGGTDIPALPKDALAFYGLTRELVTVTINRALYSIVELCSGQMLDNLQRGRDAVNSAKAQYGFDPGYSSPSTDSSPDATRKSASVDVSRPEVSSAIGAFLKAEHSAAALKDAAFAFGQLQHFSGRGSSRKPDIQASVLKGLETSAATVEKRSAEFAASMASLAAMEPFLCAWVDESARWITRPDSEQVAKTLARAIEQIEQTLSGLSKDRLDTTRALKHLDFYPGWVWAVLERQPISPDVIPLPRESPAETLVDLALSRSASPVWTAVACPELVDRLLLETNEDLGDMELLVLGRLSEDLAARQLAADALGVVGKLASAVGVVSAVLGLALLLVAPPALALAAGIAAYASIALAVIETGVLFDELAKRDVETLASSVRPTELLYRLAYIAKTRAEVTDGVVKSVIVALVARGTSSSAGFRSAFRALDAVEDAETVLSAIVGDRDGG